MILLTVSHDVVAVHRRMQRPSDSEKARITAAGHAVSRTESFSRGVKKKLGLTYDPFAQDFW